MDISHQVLCPIDDLINGKQEKESSFTFKKVTLNKIYTTVKQLFL